jgi:hypothetical protein
MNQNRKTIAFAFAVLIASTSAVAAQDQVSSYARQTGFQACLSTVVAMEKFFTEDTNYGSWSFVAKENPNKNLLNTTLELTFSGGSQMIDLTVAPTADGSCSYSYTRTAYFDKSCLATSKSDFMSKATFKTEINKNVSGFEDGSSKILLMSAGSGCILQKKEIGYRHATQAK